MIHRNWTTDITFKHHLNSLKRLFFFFIEDLIKIKKMYFLIKKNVLFNFSIIKHLRFGLLLS